MTADETREAAAAAFFGSHGVALASLCYSAGGAMLTVADRPEFFSKLRDGQCTFDDDARASGWIEVANRRVYFTANAGVLRVRATNELALGRSTSTLIAGAARVEPVRQAAVAAATEAHRRWER
jgi:hypothetical protein